MRLHSDWSRTPGHVTQWHHEDIDRSARSQCSLARPSPPLYLRVQAPDSAIIEQLGGEDAVQSMVLNQTVSCAIAEVMVVGVGSGATMGRGMAAVCGRTWMASRTATGSASDGVDACLPAHVLDSPTSLPSHRQAAEKFMPDRHAWQFDPGSELLGVDYTESGDMLVNVSFEPAPKPVWTVPYRDLQVRLWVRGCLKGAL